MDKSSGGDTAVKDQCQVDLVVVGGDYQRSGLEVAGGVVSLYVSF